MKDEKELSVLSSEELEQINGGTAVRKKFKCPKCNQVTMIVRYKSFRCTNPACGYTHPM